MTSLAVVGLGDDERPSVRPRACIDGRAPDRRGSKQQTGNGSNDCRGRNNQGGVGLPDWTGVHIRARSTAWREFVRRRSTQASRGVYPPSQWER